jgi:hypothetical protein
MQKIRPSQDAQVKNWRRMKPLDEQKKTEEQSAPDEQKAE